jgi:hypothetical protein
MPSLLRRPRMPRCSALSRSFLSGQALRSGGYMAAITKRGQTRSAKSQCPRFEENPVIMAEQRSVMVTHGHGGIEA